VVRFVVEDECLVVPELRHGAIGHDTSVLRTTDRLLLRDVTYGSRTGNGSPAVRVRLPAPA
jgi:hypothetical protein